MGIFGFLKRKTSARVLVIGLDGVPYTFLKKLMAEGKLPNFKQLAGEGSLVQADSIHPCVSCVAWSSYMTGRNPGKHGIYGFQDRKLDSYETYIATGKNLQGKTIWEILSERGKRVIAVNIPGSYPPRPVNGLMVGDFLSPEIEGATYPAELAGRLKNLGYRIDVEPGGGRQKDKSAFLEDLHATFEARKRALFSLMDEEAWDVLQVHFMATDRIDHFLFEQWELGAPTYAPEFERFYGAVDTMLGEVVEKLEKGTTLMLLSDHGFCSIKAEVYVNKWLQDEGYLEPLVGERPQLRELTSATRAYSMDPGRLYVNLKGREPDGSIEPGDEYENLRQELTEKLLALVCPETGERVVRSVLKREELFEGPMFERAPDLVAYPHDGYDLKGQFGRDQLFTRSALEGMHTFDDAFWYIRGRSIKGRPAIIDGAPTLLSLLGEDIPEDMDGTPRT